MDPTLQVILGADGLPAATADRPRARTSADLLTLMELAGACEPVVRALVALRAAA